MSAANPVSGAEGAFRPFTMLLILAIGILAFVATLVLGAYAPDLRSGHNGGAHALSNSATGFSGIVRLAEATGRNPLVVRNALGLDSESLVVLTPEGGATDMTAILDQRKGRPTLVVLPKWQVVADPLHKGWVKAAGLLPSLEPEGVLTPKYPLSVERRRSRLSPLRTIPDYAPAELRFTAPAALQTVEGTGFKPLITDQDGRAVLVQFGDQPLYVLADPDLLSNQAMADVKQAAAALALLDFLNSTDSPHVIFDVTLNGFGQSRSPLKLAFDPPFLAATLALAAAMLLAGWQAIVRFGPVRRPERAIAFGKAALIDNAAALVRKARREAGLGGRYAEMVRERAAIVFGAPARLREGALDDYLDRLEGRGRFSALAEAARDAHGRNELLAAAQALHHWENAR
ncbi:MAG: DUF4350 domain-containing protein [Allosphingosinicella sp.]